MNRMYEYMLSAETKNIILRPRFASFRVALMTKSDELRMEAEKHKGRMGPLCTDSQVELDEEYGKLVLNTIKLMMFLEDNGVPSQYVNSKSPTKPVRIKVKVLPRRSARLMAKYSAE